MRLSRHAWWLYLAVMVPIAITQRIVTNFSTAKRMLHALDLTLPRHEAVFGDRHQGRIENRRLRFRGALPRDQQPDVLGKGKLADEVFDEIGPAHDDRLRIGCADASSRLRLRADLQSSFSVW